MAVTNADAQIGTQIQKWPGGTVVFATADVVRNE